MTPYDILNDCILAPGSNSILSLPLQNEGEDIWAVRTVMQTPGQRVVINGVAREIPGKQIKIAVVLQRREGGCVMDEKENPERYFDILTVQNWQGDSHEELEVAIYQDEDLLKQIKDIFNG